MSTLMMTGLTKKTLLIVVASTLAVALLVALPGIAKTSLGAGSNDSRGTNDTGAASIPALLVGLLDRASTNDTAAASTSANAPSDEHERPSDEKASSKYKGSNTEGASGGGKEPNVEKAPGEANASNNYKEIHSDPVNQTPGKGEGSSGVKVGQPKPKEENPTSSLAQISQHVMQGKFSGPPLNYEVENPTDSANPWPDQQDATTNNPGQ